MRSAVGDEFLDFEKKPESLRSKVLWDAAVVPLSVAEARTRDHDPVPRSRLGAPPIGDPYPPHSSDLREPPSRFAPAPYGMRLGGTHELTSETSANENYISHVPYTSYRGLGEPVPREVPLRDYPRDLPREPLPRDLPREPLPRDSIARDPLPRELRDPRDPRHMAPLQPPPLPPRVWNDMLDEVQEVDAGMGRMRMDENGGLGPKDLREQQLRSLVDSHEKERDRSYRDPPMRGDRDGRRPMMRGRDDGRPMRDSWDERGRDRWQHSPGAPGPRDRDDWDDPRRDDRGRDWGDRGRDDWQRERRDDRGRDWNGRRDDGRWEGRRDPRDRWDGRGRGGGRGNDGWYDEPDSPLRGRDDRVDMERYVDEEVVHTDVVVSTPRSERVVEFVDVHDDRYDLDDGDDDEGFVAASDHDLFAATVAYHSGALSQAAALTNGEGGPRGRRGPPPSGPPQGGPGGPAFNGQGMALPQWFNPNIAAPNARGDQGNVPLLNGKIHPMAQWMINGQLTIHSFPPQPDATPVRITDHVFLGDFHCSVNRDTLLRLGIKGIVNCTSEIANHYPDVFAYHRISIDDTPNANIKVHFAKAIQFMDLARERGDAVLVHCLAGRARSATIVLAYLMKRARMPLRAAFEHVRRLKHDVRPNQGFWTQLIAFDKEVFGRKSMKIVDGRVVAAGPR